MEDLLVILQGMAIGSIFPAAIGIAVYYRKIPIDKYHRWSVKDIGEDKEIVLKNLNKLKLKRRINNITDYGKVISFKDRVTGFSWGNMYVIEFKENGQHKLYYNRILPTVMLYASRATRIANQLKSKLSM